MSVLIVTSLGDLVVDLFTDKCPMTCKNFLKLCKIKYYNGCLFHTVQKDFTAQTGDPTGMGAGGDSIYKFLYGDQARFFNDEIHHDLKHKSTGTVAMASAGENLNASQFYFTLRDDLDYLDGKHTVFGEIAEGLETLTRINEAYVDEKNRPYKNIRIKHTYILDDPFEDPSQLAELIPGASPDGKPKDEALDDVRLEDDWIPLDEQLRPEELEEVFREKDARASAVVLESIGDIPDADIKPPENVLFVCKLNPVTEDEDLHIIFSRFGTVIAADIIRDFKTGNSLCYAFIEFETNEACERAYLKMNNALIDDRRIKVDFSQSVAKLWSQYRRKGNQTGGNCFKCGAADHNAKDCTGGASKQQTPKYTLKDDNTQHGGERSRYDMVFDGDTPESPRKEKRHSRRQEEPSDQLGKERRHRRTSDDQDEEIKDPSGMRRGDRSRADEDGDKHRERKSSRYPEERLDEREQRSKSRENGDDREDDRKRKNDYQGRGGRRESERDRDRDRDHHRRNGDGDYRRSGGDDDDDGKRRRRDFDDIRDEQKRRHKDGDRKETKYAEEREHRHRRAEIDGRDTRHKSDRRR
ncbi:Peptidyl-prolyl cis-trans isomerase CYP59 [Linum perenne]